MDWLQAIQNAVTRSRTVYSGVVVADGPTGKGTLTEPSTWMSAAPFGAIRNIDYNELEPYESNVFVAMAVNYLTNSVAQMSFEIVNASEDNENEKALKECRDFFSSTAWAESFESGLRRLLPDLIMYDAGVFILNFPEFAYDENKVLQNTSVSPIELRCRDGRSFLKRVDIFGNVLNLYQYSFINITAEPIEYAPEEIIYMSAHPLSRSCYGVSKLDVVKSIADYLTASTDAQRALMENSLFPGGIVNMPDVLDTEKLKRLSEQYNATLKGEKNFKRWIVTGGNTDIQTIDATTIDATWIESSKFFAKVVFAIFGVPASELGFTDSETNRSTAIQQSQSFKRRGVQNLIVLLENVFNREIVHKYFSSDIDFKYIKEQDLIDETIKTDIMVKEISAGITTANEVREERGLEPIEPPVDESEPEGSWDWGDEESNTAEENAEEKTKTFKPKKVEDKAVKDIDGIMGDIEDEVLTQIKDIYES